MTSPLTSYVLCVFASDCYLPCDRFKWLQIAYDIFATSDALYTVPGSGWKSDYIAVVELKRERCESYASQRLSRSALTCA